MVDNNDTADFLNKRGVRTTDFLMYDMPGGNGTACDPHEKSCDAAQQ